MLIDRVRETDVVRSHTATGQQIGPDYPLAYNCGPVSYLGYKKVIVDKTPLRLPYTKNKGAWVKKEREKRNVITDLKPVRIQQFKGWASKATLDTRGCFPKGYTDYVLSGPIANTLMAREPMPYTLQGGRYWKNFVTAPAVDEDVVSWCLQKAYSERAVPDGELSVALAELPQLISLLTSPFQAVSKAVSKWRKLWEGDAWVYDPKKGLRSLRTKRRYPKKEVTQSVLDEASNRWLELQYGLLPSIGDANTVIDAINEKLEAIQDIMYGKSKFTAYKKQIVYRDLLGQLGSIFFVHGKAVYTGKIQYTSKCYYRYLGVPNYIQRLGFDPKDLFNVLWELTPWSFVVDWFWDIGGLLHTLAYEHSLVSLGNYVSVKFDEKLVITADNVTAWQYTVKCPPSRMWLHQEELLRRVNQPVPAMPQFNVKWFNITRSFNALSLLWQKLPR